MLWAQSTTEDYIRAVQTKETVCFREIVTLFLRVCLVLNLNKLVLTRRCPSYGHGCLQSENNWSLKNRHFTRCHCTRHTNGAKRRTSWVVEVKITRKERFLIRQNKTECKFSRESCSSSHGHYKNKQVTYLLPVGFFQLPRKYIQSSYLSLVHTSQ